MILAAITDLRESRIGREIRRANDRTNALGQCIPNRFLDDHVDVIVRTARLALDGITKLSPARIIPGTRHCTHPLTGRNRVFRECLSRQALMVTEFHATKVHHAIHHRHLDILALAGPICLIERSEQANGQMQSGAAIADLRARHERRPIRNAGCTHRTTHRLRDVFIRLEFGVGAR